MWNIKSMIKQTSPTDVPQSTSSPSSAINNIDISSQVDISSQSLNENKLQFIKTKEKAFAESYISTGDPGKAYQVISPLSTDESASVNGSKYLKKPEVKEYVLQLLNLRPTTSPEAITAKLGSLVSAEKAIVVDKEIQYVPDNGVQLEAVKTVLKIYGVVDNGVEVDARSVNISITNEEAGKLGDFVSRLEGLSQRLMSAEEQSGEVTSSGGEVIDVQASAAS